MLHVHGRSRMVDLHTEDPIALFSQWLDDAKATNLDEPTAMALATATPEGVPSVRMVLLKAVDERGFVFYTNLASRKALELHANPHAALCFHWMPLKRQVRVRGPVEQVADEEADAYFASRPRTSRIGAWASKQSQAMDDPMALEKRVARYLAKYPVGDVPRPTFWSGYRVLPHEIEFWIDRQYRLHERVLYVRQDGAWQAQRLYP